MRPRRSAGFRWTRNPPEPDPAAVVRRRRCGAELLGIFVMITARASQHLGHGVDGKLRRSIGGFVGVQQYKLAQVPAPGAALRIGSFASDGQPCGYQSKSTAKIAASQHAASWVP